MTVRLKPPGTVRPVPVSSLLTLRTQFKRVEQGTTFSFREGGPILTKIGPIHYLNNFGNSFRTASNATVFVEPPKGSDTQ